MPLVKRTVEPIYIGRTPLDKQVKNELEGVVVNSLAGVIKQLSSISKHAENLFGDLISEANTIYQRSAGLNKRVEVLYHKTTQLDSVAKEDVKVEDFSFQNHFKSDRKEEQQVLARETLPLALQEVHKRCEPPPDLNKFTPYREDQKDGLKFYTDPNYFYDLWVASQNKLIEKRRRKGKKHRKRKESKPGKQVKQVTKRVYHAVDKEFIEPGRAPPPPPNQDQSLKAQQQQHFISDPLSAPSPVPSPHVQHHPPHQTPPMEHSFAQEHPPGSAPPPPPPPGPSVAQLGAPVAPPPPPPPNMEQAGYAAGVPPPPPPPPPGQMAPMMGQGQGIPPPAPPPPTSNYSAPAPPPPPMPSIPGAPPPPMPPQMAAGGPIPPPPPTVAPAVTQAAPKPVDDSRSALLAAIEMGKKLRKVERSDEVKQQEYGSDVASILKRRIVMEISDTESDSDGSDSSDGEWSD